jgi:uncharacterized protein (TIGR02453 family)
MSAEPRRIPERSFSPALFAFMRELREHNDRDWFAANKQRYEEDVREPAFAFIGAFAPHLARISPRFVADSRPTGGSLFRIYRDTRFSKDKTPYKTHTGIHFRHEQAKDVHAPGFYLHLEPRAIFAGTGIWRPEGATLGRIRDAIAGKPDEWVRAVRGIRLSEAETLKRAPAGYDPDHPLIDDLKRKGFVAVVELDEKTVTSARFPDELARTFQASAPLMRFLCEAVGVPF